MTRSVTCADTAPVSNPLDSQSPAESLVAATTDAGWLILFMGSCGMAVDVVGPMSHAAIVAREFSIPCVINAIDGTRRISSCDRIGVHGTTRTVEILAGRKDPSA